jgi:hypothetical protein
VPEILEKLVGKLEAKGKPKSNAFAIATSALQKQGKMKKGSQQLTPKGRAVKAAKGTSKVQKPIDGKTLGSMKKSLSFD